MRYLSEYTLSLAEVRALRLTDCYSLHRVVYDLFEDVRAGARESSSGILFADKGTRKGLRQILILSDRQPRPPRQGLLRTRPLPETYLQAALYSFEIIINPVRRDNAGGKIVPVRGREAVAQWFQEKSPSWGFAVHAPSLQVTDITVERFTKGQALLTIAKATLTGRLEVDDRDAFTRAVHDGIGRAKAFGCGLLQIVPLN